MKTLKTLTRDETEHGVEYYLASEVDVLLASIGAQPATEVQAKYSLDDDPMGIRARVVDTVLGALTLGAQGANKPPEGHWLGPVWDLARAQEPADKPDNVNVLIDGDKYEVPMPVACEMLRLTMLILQPAQDYAAKNPLGGPAKVFDAMAAAIRAGDSYESVLGAYGFAEVGEAPVFWYRPVGEDGGYHEGPIHNSQIEKVRSMGGTWRELLELGPHEEWPDGAIWDVALQKCGQLHGDVLHLNREQIASVVRAFCGGQCRRAANPPADTGKAMGETS
jgi:hypothetical protein